MILSYKGKSPKIHKSVYLASGSVVTGEVTIEKETSIWYNTVIRGDISPTFIGERTNIQDNSTLHQSTGYPLIIENDVTIGHNVILHSCIIRQGAMVGMGSIILDGAEIGEAAIVGAGSLIPPGKRIPPRCLAMGSPAKVIRELEEKDFENLRRIVKSYVEKGQYYKQLEEDTSN